MVPWMVGRMQHSIKSAQTFNLSACDSDLIDKRLPKQKWSLSPNWKNKSHYSFTLFRILSILFLSSEYVHYYFHLQHKPMEIAKVQNLTLKKDLKSKVNLLDLLRSLGEFLSANYHHLPHV